MPQLQNLVVNDRAATPVAHTFVPRDIVDGVGTVIESSGVPIGNNRFSISTKRTSNGKYKCIVKLAMPVVQNETINGVVTPKVVRTAYIDLTMTVDETSTEQERKNLVGMLANALDPTKLLVNDALIKLEGIY